MKTKLISLTYRGEASVDPRFSSCMIPWCINDISSLENYSKLSLAIENGSITFYNSDFELVFTHNLKHIIGICQIQNIDSKKCFSQIKKKPDSNGNQENFIIFNGPLNALVYLIKNPRDPLLHVHLFQTDSINEDLTVFLKSGLNCSNCSRNDPFINELICLTAKKYFRFLYSNLMRILMSK